MRGITSLAGILLAPPILATAAEVSRPAYTPPPAAVSTGSIVQIIFSLLLVLAAIVLVAWLLKRVNVARQGSGSVLKVLGGIAIGQRERVVLLEVKDTWLVVGVGPGQIRTLHTLQKPADHIATDSEPPTDQANNFATVLASKLGALTQGKRNAP